VVANLRFIVLCDRGTLRRVGIRLTTSIQVLVLKLLTTICLV